MFWKMNLCKISFFILLMLSFIMNFMGLYCLMFDYYIIIEWEMFSLLSVSVEMVILLDWMSLLFMGFVLLISCLVINYSEEYMKGDEVLNRFIILVLMFVGSMMMLIISPNLISILLGWDGLGLVSYCLVIYYQNVKSYNAGMLTALTNRVGDVMLLMAVAWLLNYGSWNYLNYIMMIDYSEMQIVGLLVLMAALTKSAQIPFSSWLPAAMAAPTPVSALVHSSTLVTAGVYLLIRFDKLIMMGYFGKILLMIGCLTMFMAGIGANFEYDLKKIIALSTLSQLGLMMSSIGLGFSELAYFHMLTHALFKALLFMCAGSIIHGVNNNQDIRSLGMLWVMMPLTSVCFNVSNLALCGMPFLSGFYSKDLILESFSMMNYNWIIYMFVYISTGLTVMYSFRLLYYSMTSEWMGNVFIYANEELGSMVISMILLMLMAVIGGSMLSWLILVVPCMVNLYLYMKIMVLIMMLLGGWMGYFMFSDTNLIKMMWRNSILLEFVSSMWFMYYMSTYLLSMYPLKWGNLFYKNFDMGWMEEYGGYGMKKFVKFNSEKNQLLQNNELKVFVMSFMMWLFILYYLI
uniref:NADH-ubiquinone oxidoreductase chain 5 n=1 Tax=Ornebius bimaculatus TaxID=2153490 RepID=A0A385I1Z7_9ORTH|nr:NADH dehydrogenase subunit 5 [Ornebius bimaculatus]AXY63931.1 NADH dehydrogenase subunit 5 [Ornebius bimaculatus]